MDRVRSIIKPAILGDLIFTAPSVKGLIENVNIWTQVGYRVENKVGTSI